MQFLTIFACALATVAASPIPEDDNMFEKRQTNCANNAAVNVLSGLGARGQTFCRGLLNLPAVSTIRTVIPAPVTYVPTTILNPTGLCSAGQVPVTIPSVSVPTPTLAIPSNLLPIITRILPGFTLPTGLVAREAETEEEAELEKRQLLNLNLGALSSLLNAAIPTLAVPTGLPTPSVPTGLPITPSVALPSIRLPGIVTRVIPGLTLPTGLIAREAEAEDAAELEKRQLLNLNLGALSSLLNAAIPTLAVPTGLPTPSVPTGLPITPSVALPSIRLPGIVTRVIPGLTLPTGLIAREAEAEDAAELEKRQLLNLNLGALSSLLNAAIPTLAVPTGLPTPSVPTGLPVTPSVALPSIRLPGIVTRVIPGLTLPTRIAAREAEAEAEALEKRQTLNLPALSALAGARITAGCSCLRLTQGTTTATSTPPAVVLPTNVIVDTCTTSM